MSAPGKSETRGGARVPEEQKQAQQQSHPTFTPETPQAKTFTLFLADQMHRLPLGVVVGRSFMEAAEFAAGKYSGTIKRLELAGWRIESANGEFADLAALHPRRKSKGAA